MGKGLALFGLILIIVGILPIIFNMLAILPEIVDYFYMLNIYTLTLGGFDFSEIMLILLGLGVILLIVGAIK
ncbi:MAG: hypothetical protein EAX95_10445 [Candidatus Thorarchaeota archaeon]|nr:hypothetical protein [Candidatus Thorarchaeota archaeon]